MTARGGSELLQLLQQGTNVDTGGAQTNFDNVAEQMRSVGARLADMQTKRDELMQTCCPDGNLDASPQVKQQAETFDAEIGKLTQYYTTLQLQLSTAKSGAQEEQSTMPSSEQQSTASQQGNPTDQNNTQQGGDVQATGLDGAGLAPGGQGNPHLVVPPEVILAAQHPHQALQGRLLDPTALSPQQLQHLYPGAVPLSGLDLPKLFPIAPQTHFHPNAFGQMMASPALDDHHDDTGGPPLVSRRTRSCGPRISARERTQRKDKQRIEQIQAAKQQAITTTSVEPKEKIKQPTVYNPLREELRSGPLGGLPPEENIGRKMPSFHHSQPLDHGSHKSKAEPPASLFTHCVFYITSYPKDEEAEIAQRITQHDGQVSPINNPNVTHIMSKYINEETKQATEDNKTVCTKQWLKACVNKKNVIQPITEEVPSHLPLPSDKPVDGFNGLNVSVTGWSDKASRWMRYDTQYLIEALGARLHLTLSREVDILVIQDGMEYEKLTKAYNWNLCVVSHEWIFKCAREWRMVDLTPFVRRPPRNNVPSVLSSAQQGGLASLSCSIPVMATAPNMKTPSYGIIVPTREASALAAATGGGAPTVVPQLTSLNAAPMMAMPWLNNWVVGKPPPATTAPYPQDVMQLQKPEDQQGVDGKSMSVPGVEGVNLGNNEAGQGDQMSGGGGGNPSAGNNVNVGNTGTAPPPVSVPTTLNPLLNPALAVGMVQQGADFQFLKAWGGTVPTADDLNALSQALPIAVGVGPPPPSQQAAVSAVPTTATQPPNGAAGGVPSNNSNTQQPSTQVNITTTPVQPVDEATEGVKSVEGGTPKPGDKRKADDGSVDVEGEPPNKEARSE